MMALADRIGLWLAITREALNMTRYLGVHTIDTGGIHMAARRAGRRGRHRAPDLHRHSQVLRRQVLHPRRAGGAVPRGARGDGHPPGQRDRARRLRAQHRDVRRGSSGAVRPRGLAKELERSTALGIGRRLLSSGRGHRRRPRGSAGRVARAITQALESVAGTTRAPGGEHGGGGRHDRPNARTRSGRSSRRSRRRFARAPATGSTPATCSRRDTTSPSPADGAGADPRRVRGRGRRAAVLLSSQRQRGRAGLEQGPAHADRRREDRVGGVRLAAAATAGARACR